MKLYLNDLSFRNNEEVDEPQELVKALMDVCDRIKLYSFEKIYVPSDRKVREFTTGYSLNSFLTENPRSSILHQKLKGIMANQFVKIDYDEYEGETIQYVKWDNQESEFLKRAFNTVTPTISFKTHPDFSVHQIQITNEFLDENEQEQAVNFSLNNISDISHFATLNSFLAEKQLENDSLKAKWDAIKNPIRFVPRVIQYLTDVGFDLNWASSDANRRVSLANEAGSYIADINGWIYKPRLSARNSRKVFKAINQLVYLSIDTLHGTFEVHDRKGVHCYEINFKGEVLEDAQNNHDLDI